MPREIKNPGPPLLKIVLPFLASGLLFGLSFPPFSTPFFAWFCFVPLLLTDHYQPRARFFLGVAGGLVSQLIIFFWLWKTFGAAGVGFGVTLGCWAGLSLLLSLYWGVFNLARFPGMPGPVQLFFLPAVWVSLEWIRGIILTGFPWAYLSHSQFETPFLFQTASLGGALMVSFLIFFVNVFFSRLALAARTGFKNPATLKAETFLFITVLGAAVIYGLKTLKPASVSRTLRVAVLQGNIDQYEKWNDAYETKIRNVYHGLAGKALEKSPDLVVWPESAVPGWYPNEDFYSEWVKKVVSETQKAHVIGAVTRQAGKEYNSAFLVGPEGMIIDRYDKTHLVPFGEYIPFGKIFARWVPYLGQLGTFDAGETVPIFVVDGVKIFPNICYEAMFPNLVRLGVRKGADLIFNLTNDGWYLDTGAPGQHFSGNIFRAVENGRPLVRAANSGISSFIDSRGRILLQTPLLERGAFTVDVPIETVDTIYYRWGDWFPISCLIGSVIFLFSFLSSGKPQD